MERIPKMVNGVIPVGGRRRGPHAPDPLRAPKALELGHKVIVVVNKIDRPDQRIHEVMDEVLELLLDLNATDEQFESPPCSAPAVRAPPPTPRCARHRTLTPL